MSPSVSGVAQTTDIARVEVDALPVEPKMPDIALFFMGKKAHGEKGAESRKQGRKMGWACLRGWPSNASGHRSGWPPDAAASLISPVLNQSIGKVKTREFRNTHSGLSAG